MIPGVPKITARETEVLRLISSEHTTEEIATTLYISHDTAKTHRKNLLSKMKVRNVAGLIRKSFEQGILRIDTPKI